MPQPDGDQLCWNWNPGRSANLADSSVPPRDQTHTWSDLPVEKPTPPPRPTMGGLSAPIAAFTIHSDHDPSTIDPDATIGVFNGGIPFQATGGPGDGERRPGAPFAGGEVVLFPQPGDGIAGFRLISELGRGAFGRVFLAEESLLGNRLVALKITKAEGDEPRMLARLQHTHIVPIHSVHDDPKTGLRVMCMPYYGGANLAQVLEAAAATRGAVGEQRSLLRALDIVGLPPPSEAVSSSVPRRRSSPTPSALGGFSNLLRRDSPGGLLSALGPKSTDRGDSLISERSDGEPAPLDSRSGDDGVPASKWSIRSRLPKWSKSIETVQKAWPRSRKTINDDRAPVQPARRFLREASFVRASAWIAARLAEGLEHAHSHGLMHRDLKPSNILIAADGTPMLLDFNLAADSQEKANEDDRVRMGGTLPYMAPEHLDAFHPHGNTPPEGVDERSDIYALGLILFEMIAGHRPFAEPEPNRPILETIQIMIDERRAGAPSLRSIHPGVPGDLDAIVGKCLDPNLERRHTRAGDLAEDLRRFLDDQPLKYTSEPTLRGRFAKWLRRNPRVTGASTVGVVSLILIIALSGAVWSVDRHLTHVSARLRHKGFESRFPECQFLLNTVGGPAETLGRGITLAEETLEQAGIALNTADSTKSGGWLEALPPQEQREVRGDLAEVILLVVRARVYLADRAHQPTLKQVKMLKEAIKWLDRAEEIDPNPTLTLYDDRANYLARIGHTKRAAEDRARRDSISPTTGRDYYLLGTALLAKREPDRAEAALIKATGLDPRGFWPWFALGLCHYDQERYPESALDFAVCSVLSPRFAWPWMNRGLALAKIGRLIEARAAYDRAVEADGSLVEALANRGLVALELGDAPAAVRDLERAVVLGYRDVKIQAALGEALGRAGRTVEAIHLLDGLVAKHSKDLLPRIARGTLRSTTDPAGAEEDFRQILKVNPKDPGAFLGMARLRRLSDPVESLHFATLALESDQNRVDAIELSAWLRGSLGDPAVTIDVDRLVRNPTANRLLNAACSLALYIRRHPDPKLTDRTVGYLRRAIQSGISASTIRNDPDLVGLHQNPAFQELLAKQPGTNPPGQP